MASRTELVARIGEAGAIPADRPIDHLRRVSTAVMIGVIVGTLIGLLLFLGALSLTDLLVAIIPSLFMMLVVLVAWKFLREPRTGDPVPVVARTLATNEPYAGRYVDSGPNHGLLVPVVAAPVNGGDTFRSVILIRQEGKERTPEPPVGTLLALWQDQPGMGELNSDGGTTPEHEAMIARLTKHPRQLSNNAPALPMRRGALERRPGWAKAQWYLSLIAGALFAFVYVWLIAG